jgi:hypothetical protein
LARKGWELLSGGYKHRLELNGITKDLYEKGIRLTVARGHATATELPKSVVKRVLKPPAAGQITTVEHRVVKYVMEGGKHSDQAIKALNELYAGGLINKRTGKALDNRMVQASKAHGTIVTVTKPGGKRKRERELEFITREEWYELMMQGVYHRREKQPKYKVTLHSFNPPHTSTFTYVGESEEIAIKKAEYAFKRKYNVLNKRIDLHVGKVMQID